MAIVALSLPILKGKKPKFLKMMARLKVEPMRSVLEKSRLDAGVRERSFLQESAYGDVVIMTLEGETPMEGFATLMQDQSLSYFGYDAAFMEEVHGFTVATPPPLPTMLFDTGTNSSARVR